MPSADETRAALEHLGRLPAGLSGLVEFDPGRPLEPRVLVRLVEKEPALAFEILKLVNSSFYGVAQEVRSLAQAVVLLGVTNVRNICLSLALGHQMAPTMRSTEYDPTRYWQHSIAVGNAAKLIALAAGRGKDEIQSLYLAGLVHDLGKLALLSAFPRDYEALLARARAESREHEQLERAAFGLSHGEVGALIAERWHFPDAFVSLIVHHHEPAAGPAAPLHAVMALANAGAVRLGFGERGSLADPMTTIDFAWYELIGRAQAELDALLAAQLPAEMKAAETFLAGITKKRPR